MNLITEQVSVIIALLMFLDGVVLGIAIGIIIGISSNKIKHPESKEPEEYTGFHDKNNKDIYMNATIREWIEDKVEEDGGFWWYGVVKEVNGCKVVLQRGFDYSHCKFPDDYTFLYEEAPVCEAVDNPIFLKG